MRLSHVANVEASPTIHCEPSPEAIDLCWALLIFEPSKTRAKKICYIFTCEQKHLGFFLGADGCHTTTIPPKQIWTNNQRLQSSLRMLHHPSLPAAEANLWLQILLRAKLNCNTRSDSDHEVLGQQTYPNSLLFGSQHRAVNACHIVIIVISTSLNLVMFWWYMMSAPSSKVSFETWRTWNVVWWKLAKPCQGSGISSSPTCGDPCGPSHSPPPQRTVKDGATEG